jgi:bifunctional non-homologous end joining protein LigD
MKKNRLTEVSNHEFKVGKQLLQLTNQNKIFWPDEKFTKGDVVRYYDQISDFILPYLKNRPQSLHRFPNGINAPSFYHKNISSGTIPQWLKTEKIYSESNKEYIDYLICNDKATLLYMANLGCIEINPWNSRINKPDYPDWMVIDLDPEEIAFSEVVKVAIETKKLLDEIEIECYCKTSGATGLHIYIPLNAQYEYKTVRDFAKLIVTEVNNRLPEISSIERMPSKRKKKVYLDFLQNSKGQTLASAYSLRPRKRATVSTPLDWKEVNYKLDPGTFNMKSIFKRLDKKGDLWLPVLSKGVNINNALKIFRSST